MLDRVLGFRYIINVQTFEKKGGESRRTVVKARGKVSNF